MTHFSKEIKQSTALKRSKTIGNHYFIETNILCLQKVLNKKGGEDEGSVCVYTDVKVVFLIFRAFPLQIRQLGTSCTFNTIAICTWALVKTFWKSYFLVAVMLRCKTRNSFTKIYMVVFPSVHKSRLSTAMKN